MNAKISVFVTCVEAIIYLLLYDLDDCTFKLLSRKKTLVISYAKADMKVFLVLSNFA